MLFLVPVAFISTDTMCASSSFAMVRWHDRKIRSLAPPLRDCAGVATLFRLTVSSTPAGTDFLPVS